MIKVLGSTAVTSLHKVFLQFRWEPDVPSYLVKNVLVLSQHY